MIKIVLKNSQQLLFDGPFSGAAELFNDMGYSVSPDGWLKLGDYILPAREIRYIEDMGDDDNE